MKDLTRNKKQLGFTLIELLVVITIIGLMASVVLVATQRARTDAKNVAKAQNIRSLQKAVELYIQDNGGSYPPVSNQAVSLPILAPLIASYAIYNDPTQGSWNNGYVSAAPGLGNNASVYWGGVGAKYLCISNGGYYFYILMLTPSNRGADLALNDGGISPDHFETFGGNYTIKNTAGCP